MTLEDAISIKASPEVVWAETVDIERWPEWTPTISSVVRVDDGPFGLGSKARIKQPGQPEALWTVTEFAQGKQFTWETERLGMKMTASHEISPDGTVTKNVLRLRVTGILGFLFWPVISYAARTALSRENIGLKKRCEELAGA